MLLFEELAGRNMLVRQGHLVWDQMDLENIAERFGTPLYVYSELRLHQNARQLTEAFRQRGIAAGIFYPSRACSNLAILESIRATGIGVEVDSTGELMKALTAGFTPDRILVTGAGKSRTLLQLAVERGVRAVSTDSVSELETVADVARAMSRRINLLLEIDPGLSFPRYKPPTTYYLKSGADRYDIFPVIERALQTEQIWIKGIHLQVGAHTWTPHTLLTAGRVALDILDEIERNFGLILDWIFFGGELPAARNDLGLFTADATAEEDHDNDSSIAEALAQLLSGFRRPLTAVFSPGRRLVDDAGILLTTVRQVKTKSVRDEEGNVTDLVHWLIVDAGSNVLSHAADRTAIHPAWSVTRADLRHETRFKIGGPLYDPRDYFRCGTQGSEYYLLPAETRAGDRLAFLDVGAYSLDYMSEANSLPRAGAVLIRKNGQLHMIRHPDTYRDLIESDVFPGKYKKKPRSSTRSIKL